MVQEPLNQTVGLSLRITQSYFAYRSVLEKKVRDTSFHKFVPNGCLSLWFYVIGHDGCTPTEAVRELGLSKSTVSSQIDQLETKGMLERRPSDSDGRSVLLYLTDKSKGFKEEAEQFAAGIDAEMAAAVGEGTAEILNGLLKVHKLGYIR